MSEREKRESNLDKKLKWGGLIGAIIGAGFGIGLIVELGLASAGGGVGISWFKNRKQQAKVA